MNYNVESLDDDYFLHPDAKAILDTEQSDLKPKSILNPTKRHKSVELSEEDTPIAIYDPSQSAAVPMTPLRTIATTSKTDETEDWWEDWSIKSPIEALDVDRYADLMLLRTAAVDNDSVSHIDTQEDLADTLTKRNVQAMSSNRKRKGFVTPEDLPRTG